MTASLTYSEILQDKKIAELAISKILSQLQEQIGCTVNGIATTKIIGAKSPMIFVTIDIQLENDTTPLLNIKY